MRRMLLVLPLLATAAGWGVAAPGPARAGCAFIAVRHDIAYVGSWSRRSDPDIRPGASLRGVIEPGCSDVAGEPADPSTPEHARAIVGVPADVAMLVRGQMMVAIGYQPQAPGFPVRMPRVDELHGCGPRAAVSLSGVARARSVGINVAQVRASRPVPLADHILIELLIDSNTRITGLARNGIPYIGDGQRVRIAALLCRRPGADGPIVVARRIAADGPIVAATSAEDFLGAGWRGGASGESHTWWWLAGAGMLAAVAAAAVSRRRRPGVR
jgi:hypothetical protein